MAQKNNIRSIRLLSPAAHRWKNKTKMQSRATEQYSVKTHKGSCSHNLSNVYVAFKSTSRMNKDFFNWIFISYIIFSQNSQKFRFNHIGEKSAYLVQDFHEKLMRAPYSFKDTLYRWQDANGF